MKKSFLSFLLITLFHTSKGQLDKTTWLIGGSGSLYSYSEDFTTPTYSQTAKFTNIDISASAGYFIADKFAVGVRPSFLSAKGESSGGGTMNNFQFAIGPFARYYFLDTEKPFNLLADISYQFGTNNDIGLSRQRGKFNTLSLMGGSEIFFNTSAGLEILFGYAKNITSLKNISSSTKQGFQLSVGFQLHLENL